MRLRSWTHLQGPSSPVKVCSGGDESNTGGVDTEGDVGEVDDVEVLLLPSTVDDSLGPESSVPVVSDSASPCPSPCSNCTAAVVVVVGVAACC